MSIERWERGGAGGAFDQWFEVGDVETGINPRSVGGHAGSSVARDLRDGYPEPLGATMLIHVLGGTDPSVPDGQRGNGERGTRPGMMEQCSAHSPSGLPCHFRLSFSPGSTSSAQPVSSRTSSSRSSNSSACSPSVPFPLIPVVGIPAIECPFGLAALETRGKFTSRGEDKEQTSMTINMTLPLPGHSRRWQWQMHLAHTPVLLPRKGFAFASTTDSELPYPSGQSPNAYSS